MKSILAEISDRYPRLSYSERLFADYVVTNREQIIHMPIAELSATIGIAPSTIIAAVRKLGFEGYKEFKIALASEQLNPLNTWNPTAPREEEPRQNTYCKVVLSNVDILTESLGTMQFPLIQEAASILLHADNIYLFGVGTSAVLAREAYDFLFRLGLHLYFHEDLHYQSLSIAQMTERDAALIISQTGINNDIIRIASLLKKRQCRTIGISNYSGTPFGKYVDLLLAPLNMLSKVHENHFSLRVPILCIIETLYYVMSEQMGDKYLSMLKVNQQIVEDSSVNRSQNFRADEE